MNHIQKLQEEVKYLTKQKAICSDEVTDLMVYLTSSKFHEDTTVQVGDVLRRLETLRIYTIEG